MDEASDWIQIKETGMKWTTFTIVEQLAIVGLPYVKNRDIRLFSYADYFQKHGGVKLGDVVEFPVTAGGDMYVVGQNEDFKVAGHESDCDTVLNVKGRICRIQKYLLWAYEKRGGEPTEVGCVDSQRIVGAWKKDHGRDIFGYVIDLSDVTITLKKKASRVPEHVLRLICPELSTVNEVSGFR